MKTATATARGLAVLAVFLFAPPLPGTAPAGEEKPPPMDWAKYDDKFVDPYAHFGVDSTRDLFEKLDSAKITTYKISPLCLKIRSRGIVRSKGDGVPEITASATVTPSVIYVDLRTGGTTELSVSTGELVYADGEWRLDKRTYDNLRIVGHAGHSANGFAKVERSGRYRYVSRFGRVKDGKPTEDQWRDYTYYVGVVPYTGPIVDQMPKGLTMSFTSNVGAVGGTFYIEFDILGVLFEDAIAPAEKPAPEKKPEPALPAPEPEGGDASVHQAALDTPGEDEGVSVPAAIVLGLLGIAAAGVGATAAAGAAGAATASGAEAESGEDAPVSQFRMYVHKRFGDKIRRGSPAVQVDARMVEIPPGGGEVPRPDLSSTISITAGSGNVAIHNAAFTGDYMSAMVEALQGGDGDGVVTFRFVGEGGAFSNHVHFTLVGDPAVRLAGKYGDRAFMPSGDGKVHRFPLELVDFLEPPTVTVEAADGPLDVSVETGADGGAVLIVNNRSEKKERPVRFYEANETRLKAVSPSDDASAAVTLYLCNEGLIATFREGEKCVKGYRDHDAAGAGESPDNPAPMAFTLVDFRLGRWNADAAEFEVTRPENLALAYQDQQRISDVIGLESFEEDPQPNVDALRLRLQAGMNYPAVGDLDGEMSAMCRTADGQFFEWRDAVPLVPDAQQYSKDWETEYRRCLRIIVEYMPGELGMRKIRQLNDGLDKMGVEDLKLFRQHCWQFASRLILQEKESYLLESYWYDEAIATAEFLVYVGDVAFDAAMAPFGGPIVGFMAANVKSMLIESVTLYVERGSMGWDEIGEVLIWKRLHQAIGSADGLVQMPGFDQPGLLAKWLACFALYRFFYHWYYDLDEQKRRQGVVAALGAMMFDLTAKVSGAALGEFCKGAMKNRGVDFSARMDKEQELVNKAVIRGVDAMDVAAKAADDAVEKVADTLSEFLDRVLNGGIQFT